MVGNSSSASFPRKRESSADSELDSRFRGNDGKGELSRRQGSAGDWGAVLALTLCVSTLIASEFMPASILTPIASDLHVSEGVAGQAITLGAVGGGLLFDAGGHRATFLASAVLLAASAPFGLLGTRGPAAQASSIS
jgi:predicted MFS family arabinose efflux permease